MEFTYRAPFRSERLWRAHDIQRMSSYLAALVMSLWFGVGPLRGSILAALGLGGALGALYRLVGGRRDLQLRGALPDLVIAPLAAVLASDSMPLAVLVGTFIAATFLLVFEGVANRVAVRWLIGLAAAQVAHLVIGPIEALPDDGRGLAAGPAIVILLVGAAAISLSLGVWWRLRSVLARRESELKVILDRTPVVLGVLSRDGTLVSVLGDAERAFKSVPSDLRSMVEGFIGTPMSGHVTAGDRGFHVTLVAQGDDITFTAFDTTELDAARRRLEDLVRSKDQFVAAVSHELRTPLASVVGFADLLRGALDPGTEAYATASIVASESKEMAAIIDDLLVAARAELGTLTIRPEPVELATIGRQVVEASGDRRPTTVDTSDLQEAWAIGDPVRIRQVVRNLLTNAGRYGGPVVSIASGSTGCSAWIEVRDDGPAIPDEVASTIFEPYVSPGADAGQPGAMGLGLSVSSGLADMMNGWLRYRHEDGWSIFRLTLERTEAPYESALGATDLGGGVGHP